MNTSNRAEKKLNLYKTLKGFGMPGISNSTINVLYDTIEQIVLSDDDKEVNDIAKKINDLIKREVRSQVPHNDTKWLDHYNFCVAELQLQISKYKAIVIDNKDDQLSVSAIQAEAYQQALIYTLHLFESEKPE